MTVRTEGFSRSREPRPARTHTCMIGKPIEIPSMCGIVRRKPQSEPDEVSIALFGPGVPAMETAKAPAETSQAKLRAAAGRNGIVTNGMMTGMQLRPARDSDITGLAEQIKAVGDEGRWFAT